MTRKQCKLNLLLIWHKYFCLGSHLQNKSSKEVKSNNNRDEPPHNEVDLGPPVGKTKNNTITYYNSIKNKSVIAIILLRHKSNTIGAFSIK